MANPFNIPERTIEQVATASDTVNALPARSSVYQPVVVIVTDAKGAKTPSWPDNTGSPADEAELDRTTVLFVSKRYGEPWTRGSLKDVGVEHIIHGPNSTIAGMDKGTTVIFPDFDYSTFE